MLTLRTFLGSQLYWYNNRTIVRLPPLGLAVSILNELWLSRRHLPEFKIMACIQVAY